MVSVAALEPELAVIVPGAAVRVDRLALGAPAMPVAVNVTGLPLSVPEVAVSAFVPATVPRVQETAVAMPLAFVDTGVVGFTVPPPAVTAKVTGTPDTGLPFASLTITDGGVPTAVFTVAVCALGALLASWVAAPAVTVTLAVWVIARLLIVAETVFDSATVEESVPVATPLALVVPTGWVRVFPVPVAAKTTLAPAMGLPLPSFAVTVIVDVPLPAVIGDVAATVDCAADTGPTFTTTLAVCVIATPLIVAETVFDSATVELRVPVATPLALVVAAG
jgi:hypothetical protein